ncbi:hypothetical protein Ahy_B01g053900 [Arachis hypogaea]|uniref:Protein FAR1-RELATED SEQUENCE n=1 Tax=Arachis hypogaea TaxID=3818 RepID=A0A445ASV2_ARAHY|nr:hypothetical protein Ahy_B01g053900 [Arachis hypogaea]
MSVRRTIENNKEAEIRPSKTYQSFVAAVKGHRELNFIKKDARNYITREVNWNDFLMKYGLLDNKWLSDLYEYCHIWILIYLDHHFWAELRSTQKSESMPTFLNKFIMRNSSLIQFIKQYDNCLGSREQRERESDAAYFHTVIPCAIKSKIEAQFQQVYTHQKFRKVQA